MKKDYELAPGWKSFFVIFGVLALISFIRAIYGVADFLIRYFFSPDTTAFRTLIIVLTSALMLFFTAFMGILAWYFLYKYKYERLSLSDSGIQHHTFGITVNAKWSDVKRIKSEGLIGAVNGIYVTPCEIQRRFISLTKKSLKESIQKEIYIPLSMFDVDWRDSELGQQIKQYAPHLFQ